MSGVVVVTGAGQGLGAAIAGEFARRGDAVVLADLALDRAEDQARRLRDAGGRSFAVAADVSRESDMQALASRARALGPITAWVNNAGINRPVPLCDMTVNDFVTVLSVHAVGTFLGIQTAARLMIADGVAGAIINVTSVAALRGTPGILNYSAGKGAVTAMTKTAALELASHGIRVNAVAPVVESPMTRHLVEDPDARARYLAHVPLGRLGRPAEVASAFGFLASDAARYVTGQVLCVDGGLYMAS